MDLLSADQLMEYVVTSDALFNVTTMIRVLRSLEGKDSEISLPKMDEFLTKFNLAITQVLGIAPRRNLFPCPSPFLSSLLSVMLTLVRRAGDISF